MSEPLLRQWSMLRAIPRQPRRIDAKTLWKKVEADGYPTTLRTIQRDLVNLSSVLPIVSDESKPQGWCWAANTPQLDLPTLEPQAALVFHLAEKYLRTLMPASTLEFLSPWFKTSTNVLDSHGNGLSAWRKKVRVLAPGQPLKPPVVDGNVQENVTQALLQNKQLRVSYRPRSGESKDYVTHPLGLVVRSQTIYLVCTIGEYSDLRQLVLHRIDSAEVIDEAVKVPKGFDLDRYIEEGAFGWPLEAGRTLKLVAHFSKAAAFTIVERALEKEQTIEEIDNVTIRLTATVPDTSELRVWLLGFGNQAEVMAPASLRKELGDMLSELGQRYQQPLQ